MHQNRTAKHVSSSKLYTNSYVWLLVSIECFYGINKYNQIYFEQTKLRYLKIMEILLNR